MTKPKLHVLHIEDSKEDSELIHRLLADNGLACDVKRVETRPEVFDALETQDFDLILSDCKLPSFNGMRALEIAHALTPETPFIFVSGTIGEETAIETLRNGATDYVLKERLSRLVPAVKRALAEAEERAMCRQLQQRLREAGRLEAISILSNGIAHDFNNILTIILGHASLLNMEPQNPARVKELTSTISEAAQRGSEIVQQLLAFARKSDGHVAPTDVNSFVQKHLDGLRPNLPATVHLHFRPGDDLPKIMADGTQVERILSNLITNSLDAMEAGGELTLSTRLVKSAERPDLLPELASERYLCLTVADTGRGIDPTTREHVFEPFFTTKERGRGTGLGLPVVYGLMQAHHGYVEVKSEMGIGTSVSLYFPVPKTAPVTAPAEEVNAAAASAETLLVVEDETDVRFFLEMVLRAHNYRVLPASTVDEALALFEKHKDEIKLVFTDVGLPKIDGISLAQKLRAIKPSLPVVLASGYPTKEFKERLNELGPQAFLSKPYNTQELLQTIRRGLSGGPALQLTA